MLKNIQSLFWNLAFKFSALIVVAAFSKIFIVSFFRIPSNSMQPTLFVGDYIVVAKFIYGARLFNVFLTLKGQKTEIYRPFGFRDIRKNDVVVFNAPYFITKNKLEMNISKYYVKRCIGMPGDSVSLFFNNIESKVYIPHKGDSVLINNDNYMYYYKLIDWEQDDTAKVTCKDSLILLNNSKSSGYRFKQNYYYVIGDNYTNSEDSRNWGLLPEDYIVGKACFIWKSIDLNTRKYRFNRFFKMIK